MSNLQICLGEAARYGIGTPSYALACSKCYAQHQEDRVPANPNKVSFWTHEMWEKTSDNLYTFLMVRGGLSHGCANAARNALNGTGWERTHKVSDVANTVYYEVERKILCGKAAAQEAQDWVNKELNQTLKRYRTVEEIPLKEVVTPPSYVDEIPGDDPSEGLSGTIYEKVKDLVIKPEGYCGGLHLCPLTEFWSYDCIDNKCRINFGDTLKKNILTVMIILVVITVIIFGSLIVLRGHGISVGGN